MFFSRPGYCKQNRVITCAKAREMSVLSYIPSHDLAPAVASTALAVGIVGLIVLHVLLHRDTMSVQAPVLGDDGASSVGTSAYHDIDVHRPCEWQIYSLL
jgi:hypothetical protein